MRTARIQLVMRLAILALFGFVLYKILDVKLLREAIHNVRLELVGAALLLYFGNIAIRAYRWQIIFNKDGKQLALQEAYLVTLTGIALNMVIPATLGDIARSYYGYKLYGGKEEMLSTTLVDKMFALCSLFLIGAVSGYMVQQYVLCFVSLGSAVLTFIPIAFPRIVPWQSVNTLLRVVKRSLDREKLLKAFTLPPLLKSGILTLSVGAWLATCVYFYILCLAFPVTVSFKYILLIMPILTIVRLFPFTINALGPTEVAVAYFFGKIGIQPTLAVLISLTSNLISSVIPGVIGLGIILLYEYTNKSR
jgi:uncharacterized membrane protein YbhN (UPF0104 family)